jgi:tripartite-type tricarboxylate transporter receptor subunit TctC
MKRQLLGFLAGFLFFVLLIPTAELLSAPYYEGKMVNFVVGNPAGGGYDRIARLMAQHVPKYIPGKPAMVVQNMPGGEGVVCANHIYNLAKPDGLTFAIIDRGLVWGQLYKVEGIKFDLRNFSWIGSPTIDSIVLVIRPDLPYKTFEDLKKANKQIFLGGLAPTAMNTQFILFIKEYIGLNLQHVEYHGPPDIYLAMQRKEVDGMADGYINALMRIETGEVRPVLRDRNSRPGIENLPVNEDLTTNPMGKKIMAMHASAGAAGRFLVAPPGVPLDAMNILRNAFNAAIKDPQFQEEAKKLRMDFEYVPHEKCLEVVNFILTQPPEVVKELNRFVKF